MEFRYQAVNITGQQIQGTIIGDSRQSVLQDLRERQLVPLQLEVRKQLDLKRFLGEESFLKRDIVIGKKVKSTDFALFARQFATLFRSGVSLYDAIGVLSEQSENKFLKNALAAVRGELVEGRLLSQALAAHPDIFPPLMVSFVEAGEVSGTMDDVLDRLAVFFEREHAIYEKLKSAMMYPIIVSVISSLVSVFLLLKVVPTFVTVFTSMHLKLPWPTRLILWVSGFMQHYLLIILVIIVLLIIGYIRAMRKKSWKLVRDRLILKIPVIGTLILKSSVARVARTFSSLLSSAIPILDALELTARTVGHTVVEEALRNSQTDLSEGGRLSSALRQSSVFPPLVIQMIRVGEETGNLDILLTKVADFYETETQAMVDNFKTLMEPFMMLILGAVVGIIVLAVMLPMFSLYGQIGQAQ